MDFSLYFTQLSVGCIALAPVVPWRSVGKGYYVMMLSIGLALLPVAWLFRTPSPVPGMDVVATALLGGCGVFTLGALSVFLVGRGDIGAVLTRIGAVLGTAGIVAEGLHVADRMHSPASSGLLLAFNFLSGALLLGSVLSAMLLGHWYLVVKDLPVEPLKHLTRLLFVALGARLVATAAAFVLDPAGGRHVVDRSFLFVLVYGLFSLGCPIAMSWMVWGTVKIRSTQAATGILYGVVAFILMGEAAGRFILIKTGFPI